MGGHETPEPNIVPGPASNPADLAATILLAEYTFVSGLIPFYRRVEITALGATGATIAGLLAFVGALESAADPNRSLEGVILSLAATVPMVLLFLELMALVRIMRASAYIRSRLYPLASELSGRADILQWEFSPTKDLLKSIPETTGTSGPSPFVKWFASSTPVIAIIVLAAVGLPLAGVALSPSGALEPARFIGYASAAIALAAGGYAIFSTFRFEARDPSRSNGADDAATT